MKGLGGGYHFKEMLSFLWEAKIRQNNSGYYPTPTHELLQSNIKHMFPVIDALLLSDIQREIFSESW